MALFVGFALIRFDLSLQVSYRQVPVVAVEQVAGRDQSNRRAVVDLGGARRAVWLADPYLWVSPGDIACLEERRMLVRRWVYRRLVLPGYCRGTSFQPTEHLLGAR